MSEARCCKTRREYLTEQLLKMNCICCLFTSEVSIRYLTGFAGEDSLLMFNAGKMILLTDRRFEEEAQAVLAVGNADIVEMNNPKKEECKYIREKFTDAAAVGTIIGLEESDISLGMFKQLTGGIVLQTLDVSQLVSDMRLIKDDFEKNLIREAGSIAVKSFETLFGVIREGMSEKEIAFYLDSEMIRNGATAPSFPTIAAIGENASRPHAVPTEKCIARGDMLLLDFGAIYQGYCSDITRTIFCGTPNETYVSRYTAVLEAQEKAISMILHGVECTKVYGAALAVLERAGVAEQFTHGLGHGVGMEIHEMPTLSLNTDPTKKLCTGMVVTVEPGIYYSGWGGIRIEDTVIVENGKCEIVTLTNKQLLVFN